MRRFDFGEGVLTVVFAGILGSIPAMIFCGFAFGYDGQQSVRAWVSIWWIWAPLAFLYGIEAHKNTRV